MYTLENAELSVSILDPETDLERCGSRYCVGGYIYQITGAHHGPLLTGPRYPDPYPDVFDGQGAPDAFHNPLGEDDAPVGGEVAVLGVGRVRRTSPIEPFSARHNPEVIRFLPWRVERTATTITMQTEDSFGDWSYRLTRRLNLEGRTLDSRTEIESLGDAPLSVRWFPHPFYPPTVDDLLCRFSIPVSVPENPGFYLREDGWICQKPEHDWPRGAFQALDFTPQGEGMTIVQRHPILGEVTAVIDYAPVYLPIWGNSQTFSFEPYFATKLARDERASWGIVYGF
jgi:hypothetical protein